MSLASMYEMGRCKIRITYVLVSTGPHTLFLRTYHAASLSNPCVSRRHCDGTDAEETEVPFEFLAMAGCIDEFDRNPIFGGRLDGLYLFWGFCRCHLNPSEIKEETRGGTFRTIFYTVR
ncbi:hypothetical protein EYZ11_011426 [Aspergillus tanneri]|uniref:Uncharacterized protein n=1 Tax=Aspergillus tanneri TaxID=1220188 RepID=A0A4S3J3H1_9EURO|nr:hypothetical protein EYZ11_011426 [Aspergillus tanneri]